MLLAPKHPWFSTSTERMVVMRFPRVLVTSEVQGATQAILEFLEKKPEPRPWIVDMSDVEEISAAHRKMFSSNEERITPMSKLHVMRLAYVASKPIVRAALTAYFWMFGPPYPYRVFGDRKQAEAWIFSSGMDAGVHS